MLLAGADAVSATCRAMRRFGIVGTTASKSLRNVGPSFHTPAFPSVSIARTRE
jgi:hypothetical protein